MIRNQSGQSIGAQMVNATTGAAFVSAVTVYITIDAGAQAIGTVAAGVCTAEGNGYFTYQPAQAETDGDLIAFTFVGVGAVPATIQVATITEVQQAALLAGSLAGAATGRDIVTAAMLEMGAIGIDETPDDAIMVFGLSKLNIVLDNWNGERAAVYADAFDLYALTPSLTPHLIGPTGTWVVNSRPQNIVGANLVFNTVTPAVRSTIVVRDAQWWKNQTVKTLTSTIPTDLYYEPDWPNGKLFFWPVPLTAFQVELQTRIVLAQLTLNTAYTMPPGYKDATVLTLAEDLCAPLGRSMPADLAVRAARSRARVFNNNDVTPRIMTADYGMTPGGRGGRWDWRIGRNR